MSSTKLPTSEVNEISLSQITGSNLDFSVIPPFGSGANDKYSYHL